MSDAHVLDASALLCLLRAEDGAATVRRALANSSMSAVNLSEVIAKMTELGLDAAEIDEALAPLPIRIVPFDAAQARAAGLLRAATRHLGLSLGDRACLALADAQSVPALTTDRDWQQLDMADVRLAR